MDMDIDTEAQGTESAQAEGIDFDNITDVLSQIFAVVETYPMGGNGAWYFFLNDWDRRFVLNIYDVYVTTGKAPLSEKQGKKARVILRKMLTPPACLGPAVNNGGPENAIE